jgi:peptidoglycan/LPS O-acetylase OafA/YrhL
MSEPRPFFGRIESLRGIGAVAVAGYHLSGSGLHGLSLLPHQPWATASAAENAVGRFVLMLFPGHAALMMFFAISGCVLYVSLQYGPQMFGPAAIRFFVARIFRIYPIVFFGVLFAAWVQGWHTATPQTASHSLDAGEIVANMLLLQATVNSTLWALQLEAIMAPIILLLYFLDRAYGPRALLALGLVTTALTFSNWAVWPPLSTNMFAFILGMLIPTLGRQWASGLSRRAANWWMLGSVAAMFAAGPVFGFYSRFAGVSETYAALALLSLAAYRSDVRGSHLLESWPMRQLGVCSGSYYVLHIPLFMLFMAAAPMVVPAAWSAQAPLLVGSILIAVALVAIAPICLLSYHLIEAQGIALGRRLIQSRRVVAAE